MKQNLINLKSLVVHALDSKSQAICNYDLYYKRVGYELTDNRVTCGSCLHLMDKQEKNNTQDKPQRKIQYKFIREFVPTRLLHDQNVQRVDRKAFSAWCLDHEIPLDKPMIMNELLEKKLDEHGCFKRWLDSKGFLRIEELPVTISLTFKNSRQYHKLVNKINFANSNPFNSSIHPHLRLGPAGNAIYNDYFQQDEILNQLMNYKSLFK